jgi:purine-binding chemotaxis protein CheW
MEEQKSYDIRSILEEMRQEYWQGLSAKTEVQDEFLECITFTLGGEIYAFATGYAAEVIRVPKLVRVPGVQELIVGIFNLRGEIIAAMDIRPLLGVSTPPLGAAARVIVVKGEGFTTGILTEAVLGVHPFSLGSFEPVVKSVSPAAREFLRGQINRDGEMSILLDIQKLLSSPQLVVHHQS